MPHVCQWPPPCEDEEDDNAVHLRSNVEQCDAPATNTMTITNVTLWLCAKHYDFLADVFRHMAKRDGNVASVMSQILKENGI